MFDYLIVGAGFAGSVLAERLASQLNKRVLLVDKRPHIGGNAYDHYDDHGLLVHKYGPHIFHTETPPKVMHLSARSSPTGGPTSTGCWRLGRWTSCCPFPSTSTR